MHSKPWWLGLLVVLAACSTTAHMADGTPPTFQPTIVLHTPVTYPLFLPGTPLGDVHAQAPHLSSNGTATLVDVAYQTPQHADALRVLNGPVGCCLDAAGDKALSPVRLANGDTAYYLRNGPNFGGDILWWQHAHTYLALASPQFSHEQLVAIANSMRAARIIVQP